MSPPLRNDIAFGPFRLDIKRRSLARDGRPVAIGGRAFDILVALAGSDGETVGKQALLDQVWPGLTVEDNNLAVHISALRKLLGEEQIITIPGRGYRLNVSPTNPAPPEPFDHAGRPSIAVLPFAVFSEDASLELFADGIVDDIITALCRIRWLFVVSRTSSFAYKGSSENAKRIGIGLGVRYLLTGGIRRSGGRIRITVQLVNAEDDDHVWADRFDRDVADILPVLDDMTDVIIAAIAPAIADAERRRVVRKRAANLSAWEAYHLGRCIF